MKQIKQDKKRKNFNEIYRKYKLENITLPTNGIKCKICGEHLKSISGFGSHILYKHNVLLEDYIQQYFLNLTPDFKFEKCSFCDNNALPTMKIDYEKQTYTLIYDHGYICNTNECKDAICIDFFGKPHHEVKHKYEHLGANVKFLAKLYKKTEEDVRMNIKRNPNYVSTPEKTTSLVGYIARYGKKEGTKKYKERCKKISYSLTIDWYIEKYGIIEGTKKYQARYKNAINVTKDIIYSKHQYEISDALKKIDPDWEDERYCGGFTCVDITNKRLGIAFEYFGDYWHCNPKVYKKNFYNKSLKMTAKEKLNYDNIRLNKILARSKDISLIVVLWEKSFNEIKDLNIICNMIYDALKYHDKNKKEIIWL